MTIDCLWKSHLEAVFFIYLIVLKYPHCLLHLKTSLMISTDSIMVLQNLRAHLLSESKVAVMGPKWRGSKSFCVVYLTWVLLFGGFDLSLEFFRGRHVKCFFSSCLHNRWVVGWVCLRRRLRCYRRFTRGPQSVFIWNQISPDSFQRRKKILHPYADQLFQHFLEKKKRKKRESICMVRIRTCSPLNHRAVKQRFKTSHELLTHPAQTCEPQTAL